MSFSENIFEQSFHKDITDWKNKINFLMDDAYKLMDFILTDIGQEYDWGMLLSTILRLTEINGNLSSITRIFILKDCLNDNQKSKHTYSQMLDLELSIAESSIVRCIDILRGIQRNTPTASHAKYSREVEDTMEKLRKLIGTVYENDAK